jgi:hypothetical protein
MDAAVNPAGAAWETGPARLKGERASRRSADFGRNLQGYGS